MSQKDTSTVVTQVSMAQGPSVQPTPTPVVTSATVAAIETAKSVSASLPAAHDVSGSAKMAAQNPDHYEVVVRAPAAHGMLAYLVGPGAEVVMKDIDLSKAQMANEAGNLRITLPNGAEILLLDFMTSAHSKQGVMVMTGEGEIHANQLLASLDDSLENKLEKVEPAEGIQNTGSNGRGEGGGFEVPTVNGVHYGDANPVLSEVIGPFGLGLHRDSIFQKVYPEGQGPGTPVLPPHTSLDANPDSYTTHCETPITFDTKVNDVNPEGTPFKITSFTQPDHGTVVLNANGTFTYTPDDRSLGNHTFSYTITDGEGDVATTTVTLHVVDLPPVAVDDHYTTKQGTPITFDTKVNDSDPDGDPFTIVGHTNPANGTLVQNADGTFTYVPNAGFHGTDTFTYTIADGCNLQSTATVTITVPENPHSLNANPDTYTTHCETPITFDVKVNDVNPEGTPIKITGFTQPDHGTVVLNANGTFTYTPDDRSLGDHTFTYSITDGEGDVATTTVTLHVVDQPPVAVNDSYTTKQDTPITFDTKVNDSDPDGDTITVVSNTNPAHGTVVLNADNTFTYTPAAGFHGTDTFTYTIADDCNEKSTATVTIVVPENPHSLDAHPDTYTTHCETPITFDVKVNDVNPEGTPFSVINFTQPDHGTVVLNANGTFTYTPDDRSLGDHTFTYTIKDAEGDVSTATVTLHVVDLPPVAVDDHYKTDVNTPITFDTKVNDSDPDGDKFSIVSNTNPSHGTVTLNADGTFSYVPNAGFHGTDSFTYTIADDCNLKSTATVTIEVDSHGLIAKPDEYTTHCETPITFDTKVNDSNPDGTSFKITSFTQPDHGTVTLNANGTFTYVPDDRSLGDHTFTYTITDGEGETATTTVTLHVVDLPPVAVNDSYTTNQGTPITFDTKVNDRDPDGDPFSITGHSNPSHGTLTQNADGTFTYVPAAGFHGTDSFTYTIADDCGLTSTATVDICVNQVTHGLNANPDTYSTHCDTPITFDTKVNDVNPDGTPFSITGFTQPTHGVVTENANGTFTYTPTGHWLGADTFTYTITDAEGEHATTTVKVNITDNAPVAVADNYTTNQNTAITFDTKVNDHDPDGDPFSITGHTNPSHGTVTENANGTFTYVPANGFHGSDSFTYTITDDCGLSSTATVCINVNETVTPPPPPPPPPVCPLTIDLGGDGIQMNHDGKSSFDLTGDGTTTHTAWVGANEGILVHDVAADGNVTLDNVFGPHTNDGFTELAQLEDTNHDGMVNANDAGWNTLKVWTDTNGDGISEAGELHSLSDLGITGISVSDVHATAQDFGDAYITSSSTVTYADGHTTDMSDVFYQLNAKVDTGAVLGQQSEIVAGNSGDVVTAPVQAPAADTHVAVSSGAELLNHIEQPVHPV